LKQEYNKKLGDRGNLQETAKIKLFDPGIFGIANS
jgi:hypothetical protein